MISNPEVKRTLATLRKAEFGFLGVIVEKLTDKSSLLPLYRTVHEIFTSYGSWKALSKSKDRDDYLSRDISIRYRRFKFIKRF